MIMNQTDSYITSVTAVKAACPYVPTDSGRN